MDKSSVVAQAKHVAAIRPADRAQFVVPALGAADSVQVKDADVAAPLPAVRRRSAAQQVPSHSALYAVLVAAGTHRAGGLKPAARTPCAAEQIKLVRTDAAKSRDPDQPS